MGFDTKTYWLTDRQSQCDFDFDYLLVIYLLYTKVRATLILQEGTTNNKGSAK
jgi:hypothetical protein